MTGGRQIAGTPRAFFGAAQNVAVFTSEEALSAPYALSVPVRHHGTAYRFVSIDRDGFLFLHQTNPGAAWHPVSGPSDLAAAPPAGCPDTAFVLAPYWAALEFGPTSRIIAYEFGAADGYACVEYRDMQLAGRPHRPEFAVSFQVWLARNPGTGAGGGIGVCFNYQDVGERATGADAAVGIRPPGVLTRVAFEFGDPSESRSEKYRLTVTPTDGAGERPRAYAWCNAQFGACKGKDVLLKPGWRYEVRLTHVASTLESPDCDYRLVCHLNAATENVKIDNPDGLFGDHYTSTGVFAGEGKAATVTVYRIGVAVCAPDDPGWADLAASRVILDDEPLRVKVTVAPPMADLDAVQDAFWCDVKISTSGTNPQGAWIPLDGAAFANTGGASEIRLSLSRAQLAARGLLPAQDDDGVAEFAVVDMGENNTTADSNLLDSDAFCQMENYGYRYRGRAIGDADSRSLSANPPTSEPSESFIRAGGCEILAVLYCGWGSPKVQIMNQADYLYYSGHGLHSLAMIDEYTPESMANYWSRDLDCVIFAACSVLDIGDFNHNFFDAPNLPGGLSPGKRWECVGPSVLLGYNADAPLDKTGYPRKIIQAWLTYKTSLFDEAEAWMLANRECKVWNACAIVKGKHYLYFDKNSSFKRRRLTILKKEDWP